MLPESEGRPAASAPSSLTIDFAVRLALLGLLCYWAWKVVSPFLTIVLWSAILAVALYPLFEALTQRLGRRWLAATVVTALCLAIVVGPVIWLGFGMIHGVGNLMREIEAGHLSIPAPAESVKAWPIVGERLYQIWSHAATDVKAELVEAAPLLKSVGVNLLDVSRNALLGLVQFLASIIVAGFLLSPGPQLIDALNSLLERVLNRRGGEMVRLAGTTIRSVARGVVGIALLQAFLAGLGFLWAGIPGASVLAFLALVLGIVQIGPAIMIVPIVIWSWTSMTTTSALLFTAYMIPVSLIDNILKPIIMARGLTTPMPVIVIGVIGGTLAYGIVGLFFGPIVLSVAWEIVVAWVREGDARSKEKALGAIVPDPQEPDTLRKEGL